MPRPTRFIALAALPALAAGVLLLGSGASAQAPGERTLSLKENERGATFVHIRNTRSKNPNANLQGDLIVFTNPLADASGAVVGRLSATCTTTTGARNFLKSVLTCTGVLALEDGTLTIAANTSPGKPVTTGTVTGGTGAYANARGVFRSEQARGGSQDTITLVG
jgi:hypothetical protein